MLSNILVPIGILALFVGIGYLLIKFLKDKQVTAWLLVAVAALVIWLFTR